MWLSKQNFTIFVNLRSMAWPEVTTCANPVNLSRIWLLSQRAICLFLFYGSRASFYQNWSNDPLWLAGKTKIERYWWVSWKVFFGGVLRVSNWTLQSIPGVTSRIYCVDQNPNPYSAPLLASFHFDFSTYLADLAFHFLTLKFLFLIVFGFDFLKVGFHFFALLTYFIFIVLTFRLFWIFRHLTFLLLDNQIFCHQTFYLFDFLSFYHFSFAFLPFDSWSWDPRARRWPRVQTNGQEKPIPALGHRRCTAIPFIAKQTIKLVFYGCLQTTAHVAMAGWVLP